MNIWDLPETINIHGEEYRIRSDFRDVLAVISHLEDVNNPDWLRWRIAVSVFYEDKVPDKYASEAMEKMAEFIAYENTKSNTSIRLIDWEQDATSIISGVNKAAGKDVRSVPFVHWWTFLSYFHEIGEGQLQTIVSIRDKLKRGKKLEKWEKEYYQKNKSKIDMKKRYTEEELEEIESIKKWL